MLDRLKPEVCYRLAPKARLRHDQVRGGYVLLYPERGLALNETAAEILLACDGDTSIGTILDDLAARSGVPRHVVAEDARTFLAELLSRGLLRGAPP